MIQDFTEYILPYCSSYQRKTVEKFEYNGITLPGNEVTTTIKGILQPLTSEDRIEILSLGHQIAGKKVFYSPSSEGIMQENDILVESDGTEWVVTPHTSDYSDLAGYVKYRLERRVL